MAVSRTEICNMALSHVGNTQLIDHLDEKSQQAVLCKTFYFNKLDFLLRRYDWPFARRVENLELISENLSHVNNSGWRFTYRQPNDCIKINHIFNPNHSRVSRSQIQYERGRNDSSKVIYTNQEDARLDYVSRPDESFFDADFSYLLSLAVAVSIAMPLSSDSRVLANVQQLYSDALRDAKLAAAQESTQGDQPESELITVRDVELYDDIKGRLE